MLRGGIKLCVKIFALYFVLVAFAPQVILHASQPPGGWREDVDVKGEPLTVAWGSPSLRPKCLIWMEDYSVSKPYYVSNGDEVRIERIGKNRFPVRLLVVPESNVLLPKILDVPAETKRIDFVTETVPKNEIWFWGVTPENPFPTPKGPAAVFVSVRMLRHKDVYAEFNGAFLWRIKQNTSQDLVEPLYFFTEGIATISSGGFENASDAAGALCKAYAGGDCPFLFETTRSSWGKSYQITFQTKPESGPAIY